MLTVYATVSIVVLSIAALAVLALLLRAIFDAEAADVLKTDADRDADLWNRNARPFYMDETGATSRAHERAWSGHDRKDR